MDPDRPVIGELTYRELLVAAFAAGGYTAQEAVSEANAAITAMAKRGKTGRFRLHDQGPSQKGQQAAEG